MTTCTRAVHIRYICPTYYRHSCGIKDFKLMGVTVLDILQVMNYDKQGK